MYGPAGIQDAYIGYLFRCGDLFAVTLDEAGANIPHDGCYELWQRVAKFELGVNDAVPAAINPEPILRGIKAYGYYVWSEGRVSGGEGTTQ